MPEPESFFANLTVTDLELIRHNATERRVGKDRLIFAQGDEGDSFYIIEQGRVTVFCDDRGTTKQLRTLSRGDYFGEMGVLSRDRRSASVRALEDSILLCLDRITFIELLQTHPDLDKKIQNVFAQRSEELILRESLCDAMGIRGENLYVSIKGDPSLRETALFRDRYQSPLDKILDELQPKLTDLILNRSAFHVVIHFNSGEIGVRTILDPFREKVHTAEMMNDRAYLDRHFTETPFEEKLDLIKGIYQYISKSHLFAQLPGHWQNLYTKSHEQWQPLAREEVKNVMSRLVQLRSIPEFYLRNIGVNLVQDAIRLQFNCDGTHIVSAEDYQAFIKKNLILE
jgi:CRP-like cAMP-binding protein